MSRAMGQTSSARVIPRKTVWELIDQSDTRNAAMIALLYLTAARKGELIQLTRDDLFREEDFMMINLPIEKRKVKNLIRCLPVPLYDEFMEPVNKYIKTVKTGRLFPITGARVWQITKAMGFFPHEFRHSRLTEVSAYFANDMDIDRFAGWKFPGMKSIYVHLRMDHLKDPLLVCSFMSDTTKGDVWLQKLKMVPQGSAIWQKYPQHSPYSH